MRCQYHYFRVVIVEQGNLLAAMVKSAVQTAIQTPTPSPVRAAVCASRAELCPKPQTKADADGDRGRQRHRQDEHQRAEVQRNLRPAIVPMPSGETSRATTANRVTSKNSASAMGSPSCTQTHHNVPVRRAERTLIANITQERACLTKVSMRKEHHPVYRRCCHAAAYAAKLRHAKMAVNKDIVHRNVDQ